MHISLDKVYRYKSDFYAKISVVAKVLDNLLFVISFKVLHVSLANNTQRFRVTYYNIVFSGLRMSKFRPKTMICRQNAMFLFLLEKSQLTLNNCFVKLTVFMLYLRSVAENGFNDSKVTTFDFSNGDHGTTKKIFDVTELEEILDENHSKSQNRTLKSIIYDIKKSWHNNNTVGKYSEGENEELHYLKKTQYGN